MNKIVIVEEDDFIKTTKNLVFSHICEQTYHLSGPEHLVNFFINGDHCVDAKDCHFPECEWNIEYKYLGDFKVGTVVSFDLRLIQESQGYEYALTSPLALEGLSFSKGILSGTSQEETDIVSLEIEAKAKGHPTKRRIYQIRFFREINVNKSFTHNNYLKLGYGKDMIDYDANQVFNRLIEPSEYSDALNPVQECIQAAKIIYQHAVDNKLDLELYASGGIDSQCMIQSFLLAKVPFKVVLMQDIGGSNIDDIYWAQKFLSKKSLNFELIQLSYKDYISNYQYVEPALSYRFNNPEYGLLLELMLSRPHAFPVYAGRPISVSFDSNKKKGLGLAVDETWSRARLLERTGRIGCPEFLVYTKRMVEAFMSTSYFREFSKTSWFYDDKVALLKDAGFDVSLAPPKKYTGFEKLWSQFPQDHFGSDIWVHHRGPLKARFPNAHYRNMIPLDANSRIGDWRNSVLKKYPDGFSYRYIHHNNIEQYH